MDRGALLITPRQNTIIETPYGRVGIAKDSVALIIAFESGLAVYDLHDAHANSIFINCSLAKTNISLSPGGSAIVTHQDVQRFEQINPTALVAYKKMANRPVGNEYRVFQGQFEILSMIRALAPLRNMVVSNDSAMRKAAARMIKTAAILSQFTDAEPYCTYGAPELAAYAPASGH